MTAEHGRRSPPEGVAAPSLSSGAPSAPCRLEVRYRSVSALLMAYASRLSRGEIFLEAAEPLAIGTRTMLRLQAPGATAVQIEGVVNWTRPMALGPGLPAGMGIALATSLENQGAVIDDLAARFGGIRMLVASADAGMRAAVSRYLRSILTCHVVETTIPLVLRVAAQQTEVGLDLIVVDLDAERQEAMSVLPLLMTSATRTEVPLIALAQHEHDRAAAAAVGVREVLGTPPVFGEVRSAVIHALSSPAAFTVH